MAAEPQFTLLLSQMETGDEAARNKLVSLVHDELRAEARRQMGKERPGHTLQTTALVNQACLRLFEGAPISCSSKAHFFNVVAVAMRQILVDHSRQHKAKKRNAKDGQLFVQSRLIDFSSEDGPDYEKIANAMDELQSFDALAHEVVKHHYWSGRNRAQIADILAISVSSVQRHLNTAYAILRRTLSESP